jgi:hypothetical protein
VCRRRQVDKYDNLYGTLGMVQPDSEATVDLGEQLVKLGFAKVRAGVQSHARRRKWREFVAKPKSKAPRPFPGTAGLTGGHGPGAWRMLVYLVFLSVRSGARPPVGPAPGWRDVA